MPRRLISATDGVNGKMHISLLNKYKPDFKAGDFQNFFAFGMWIVNALEKMNYFSQYHKIS